ncbi:nitrile hydratase accessory protein [Stappia sp.]|uniref:nitrile hydratase accessory protein n=1 Tax=Stappia sp. TaxID=1870903 RepID=UPI003A990620
MFSDLPRNGDEPVFREPWEARAFAMAVELHASGLFTWPEWAQALSTAIRDAQADGDPDCGDSYYRHWLAALEAIVVTRAVATTEGLAERREAWHRAAAATPHGEPIELGRDDAPVRPA